MAQQPTSTRQHRQAGQSLVEVALFMPILIVLIAGVVELSQLVITQNRVSNAARVAARFGANGGEDDGMTVVALNSVTQTLEMDENRWDMWTIRARVNEDGDDFEDWTFAHSFGVSNTVLFSGVNESAVQQEVLAELQRDEQGATNNSIAGGLRIVGSLMVHDVDSIIGLDAFPALAEFSSVRALNVMRLTGLEHEPTAGCDAFPIAVRDDARSVTKPISELLPGEESPHPYPEPNEFTCPSSSPQCEESVPPTYSQFTNHRPNVALAEAEEGDVFKIKEGTGSGNFGWLRWNNLYLQPSAGVLGNALRWPGNSSDYPTNGYYEPDDPTDTTMKIGNWVAATQGNTNAVEVRTQLDEHMKKDRTLRLIVWDKTEGAGNNLIYHISGFAIFRLHGYNGTSGQGGPWILAEFIKWDNSCGQVIPDPDAP